MTKTPFCRIGLFRNICYNCNTKEGKAVSMCQKFTANELNSMNHDAKNEIIYQMQDRLDKLEHDMKI